MPRSPAELVAKWTSTTVKKELAVGISHYVDPEAQGFKGTLKQRYTDFQVHEISIGGKVVTIADGGVAPRFIAPDAIPDRQGSDEPEDIKPKFTKPAPLSTIVPPSTVTVASTAVPTKTDLLFSMEPETERYLIKYFDPEGKDKLVELYLTVLSKPNQKSASFPTVTSLVIEREIRPEVHEQIRQIFKGRFDSRTETSHCITVFVARSNTLHQSTKPAQGQSRNNNNQIKGKIGWDEKGGEFLHMSLYKENKDVSEVVGFLASQLKAKRGDFGVAGTKDRRAATVQRMSIRRQTAERLAQVNKTLRNAYVGNFKYEKQGLELGELEGNVFVITLRDAEFDYPAGLDDEGKRAYAQSFLDDRVKRIQQNGFINYFGLQRFGSFSVGTDEVGLFILQGNFEAAVNAVLHYNEDIVNGGSLSDNFNRDDRDRALAIWEFKKRGSTDAVKKIMPRKYSNERDIILHLEKSKNDFLGAIQKVPRNMKTMYVHAYQSRVWNAVASVRWARYGKQVIKGDLVLIDIQAEKMDTRDEIDENGEVVIHPAVYDLAVQPDDIFQRARTLTAEEAASGQYDIFDVVLPTPGFDVTYPDNDIGDFYKEFMSSERGGGIDPGNMRRTQKEFSLSGSYRPLLAEVSSDMTAEARIYYDSNTQLVDTDLDKLRKLKSPKKEVINTNTPANAPANTNGPTKVMKTSSSTSPSSTRTRSPPVRKYGDIREMELAKAREAIKKSPNAMSGWFNLANTIGQSDREMAEEADAERKRLQAVGLVGPGFTETWHETAEDCCKRTGNKSTTVVAEENVVKKENTSPVASPLVKTEVASPKVKTEEDVHATPVTASFVAPTTPPETAAVPIPSTPENSKRTAEQISKSASSSPLAYDGKPEYTRIAVILTFSLGPSQYATMALRELMKADGVRTYKPDFYSGR